MSKKPGAPTAPKRPQRRWRAGYAAAVLLAPIALLLIGAIVWEARKPARIPSDPTDRVTDVAPQVTPGVVAPERRDPFNRDTAEENGLPEEVDRPAPPDPSSILPDIFPDMHNPPQWNETRAAPGRPVPPDPNIPPPMEIDPLTGKAPGAEGAQPRQPAPRTGEAPDEEGAQPAQ